MPRRSKRDIFDQARPTVEALIASLRKSENTEQADAVQAVLGLAEDAVHTAQGQAELDAKLDKPFAVPVESGLWSRVSKNAPNTSELLIEGWEKFLAGEWTPVQPARAGHGMGVAKANVNVRATKDLLARVEAAADRLVEEKGWSTARGYKLNARQIAAQWLARKYPAAAGESEAAAE
jgi:hypothetical protein